MIMLTQSQFARLRGQKRGQKFARGQRPRKQPGSMNKLEAAYDAHLQRLEDEGAIYWRKFEGVNLKLADKTYYKVDFFVLAGDGYLEAHETKDVWRVKVRDKHGTPTGERIEKVHIEDDAAVKIKIAAKEYPVIRFFIVYRSKASGEWVKQPVGNYGEAA